MKKYTCFFLLLLAPSFLNIFEINALATKKDLIQLQVPFSTNKQNLTVWNGESYVPFFIKGTNLGVSVPGTFPGELVITDPIDYNPQARINWQTILLLSKTKD